MAGKRAFPVAVMPGDGIGPPEVMAVRIALREALEAVETGFKRDLEAAPAVRSPSP